MGSKKARGDINDIIAAWNESGSYRKLFQEFPFPTIDAVRGCINHLRRRGHSLRKSAWEPLHASLFSHIDKVESTGCWEWNKKRNASGYGVVVYQGKKTGAHCAAWTMHNGITIPIGMVIMHKCDNPPCINPIHLQLGTYRDNVLDCSKKGRRHDQKGEGNSFAKLTESDVMRLRSLRSKGMSYAAISRETGINNATCRDAILGITWGHVK